MAVRDADDRAAARPQHANHLAERALRVAEVLDGPHRVDGVEAGVARRAARGRRRPRAWSGSTVERGARLGDDRPRNVDAERVRALPRRPDEDARVPRLVPEIGLEDPQPAQRREVLGEAAGARSARSSGSRPRRRGPGSCRPRPSQKRRYADPGRGGGPGALTRGLRHGVRPGAGRGRDREHLAVVEALDAAQAVGGGLPANHRPAVVSRRTSRCVKPAAASRRGQVGLRAVVELAARRHHLPAGQPRHRGLGGRGLRAVEDAQRRRAAARPSGARRSAARPARATAARPRTRRRRAAAAPRRRSCPRRVPARSSQSSADARQQRRHELDDHAEAGVGPEHRHHAVQQAGRPDDRERADRCARARASRRARRPRERRGSGRSRAPRAAGRAPSHRTAATRPSATIPQPRLTCCSSSRRRRRSPARCAARSRRATGFWTGGTR